MNTFELEIMASDHKVFAGEAYSVVVPTTEGQVGILAGHSNLIMAVIPGFLEFEPAPGQELNGRQTVVVSEGLLKVENGEAIILVDTAESPDDVDVERAGRSAERAREDLRKLSSAREKSAASARLSRAMSRMRAAQMKHRR